MQSMILCNHLFDLLPFLCFLSLQKPLPALPPLRLFVLVQLDARLLCLVLVVTAKTREGRSSDSAVGVQWMLALGQEPRVEPLQVDDADD